MKLSVCVDAVFRGKDIYEGLKIIKDAGFNSIEFWGWSDKDIIRMKQVTSELGLNVCTFCTRMFSLADPSKRDEYKKCLLETIKIAEELGCKRLITQVAIKYGESPEKSKGTVSLPVLRNSYLYW